MIEFWDIELEDELDLEVQERTKELRLEKQKSDDLLLNILPEEVANELGAPQLVERLRRLK